MLKVLHLNSNDIEGGAARAAYRLNQGLQKIGVNSQMLVQKKNSDEKTVISPLTKVEKAIATFKPTINNLPFLLYPNRDRTPYSIQWVPDRLASKVAQLTPDILNLHWINGGFLQIETLAQLNQPIVWTLHDMWPLTGGCHYSGDCDRYTQSCGVCPQLGSHQEWDLSRWVWKRKAKAWKNLNLTLVTPSRWLADRARNSSLFLDLRIEVIPNGLDIHKFKPIDPKIARELLGLPPDKQLILFGAMSASSDRRKGFHLLLPALEKLSKSQGHNQIELVVFGASEPVDPPDIGFKINYLGRLNDDISLALVYSAADVMIVPSIEDNLPNTVMEALACGTPCVAFKIGGMSDMIEHERNGYLAVPFTIDDLAHGIAWVLEDEPRYSKLRDRAREKVEQEFSLAIQARQYLTLYEELSNSTGALIES